MKKNGSNETSVNTNLLFSFTEVICYANTFKRGKASFGGFELIKCGLLLRFFSLTWDIEHLSFFIRYILSYV